MRLCPRFNPGVGFPCPGIYHSGHRPGTCPPLVLLGKLSRTPTSGYSYNSFSSSSFSHPIEAQLRRSFTVRLARYRISANFNLLNPNSFTDRGAA